MSGEAVAAILCLTARIEELEAALKPFAEMLAEGVVKPLPDRPAYTTVTTCIEYFESVGAALNGGGDGE